RKVPWEQAGPGDWTEIYLGLGVTGILQSTVANCQMTNRQGNDFYFVLDKANSTLYDTSHEKRLADLLSDYFVEPVRAHIQMGEITAETPSMMAIRVREERLQDAVSAIKNDPIVQQLIAQFGATLREETIQPI
ncbi:MAG: polymerase subunit gamma/tau, partial [Cellvibrio sp.]|nr:polymerase subunit gamma/tau [Cellvibrio sp.]